MGALHDGHASLVREGVGIARQRGLAGGCIVSIFVNPTQFNEPSDYSRYPRTLSTDLPICERAGASAVYAPAPEEIYPLNPPIRVPPLPLCATSPELEDRFRPGHFAGVCQVVLRLFELVRPAIAVFGEKDWQQLQVVRAMTAAEKLPIEIVGLPTIRERNGLAMSSRNRFLGESDRARAAAISRALCRAAGEPAVSEAERAMHHELREAMIEPEYAVVRDAETLSTWREGRPGRALIAARVGSVRLIDNAPWQSLS